MVEMVVNGGPFMFLVVLFGLAALAFNVLQLARRDRNYLGPILGLTAAGLLAGITGTSAGIYQLTRAVMAADAAQQFTLYMSGLGIAHSTTEIGALLAVVNVALVGIAHGRMVRRRAPAA